MKKLTEVSLEACLKQPFTTAELESVLELVRTPGWKIIKRAFVDPAFTLGPSDLVHGEESIEFQVGVFAGWEEFADGLELLERNVLTALERNQTLLEDTEDA